MLIRRLLMSMVVTGALVLGVAGPAGSFPTGFTVTPPNAPAGVLTATLVGDVCNLDLRLAILDQANQQLADNGTGGVAGATQILLDINGEFGTQLPPGSYKLRVTCGEAIVGDLLAYEVVAAAPAAPAAPAADPTEAVITFTG